MNAHDAWEQINQSKVWGGGIPQNILLDLWQGIIILWKERE